MVLKKILLLPMVLSVINLTASEEIVIKDDFSTNICEISYQECMTKCEDNSVTDKEKCYSACDNAYDKCYEGQLKQQER